jgi:phage terminase Nu1 subunit (DNA packaging protein)
MTGVGKKRFFCSNGSLLGNPTWGISEAQGFPSYKNIFEKTTMSLNRSETAQKLNVSLTTLDNWRRKGCPHTKIGKQVYFEIEVLNRWLDNRSSGELDYTQERAKLTRLQAERATLDLEQQRGKLLPLEMVIVAWQGQVANARAKLLALPTKAASQVLGMESYVEVEHAIRDIIYEALDELADDGMPKEYEQRLEVMALTYSDSAYAGF